MADKILLNNEVYHIGEDGLPCLIHYAPKAGGSHFSVTMVADLFLSGSKILFLTAYPMAKDNFFQQIKGHHSDILNVSSGYGGGTITAAKFLEEFVDCKSWAHLDIAGVGDSQTHLPYCPKKGASGLMVRTLVDFAKNY